MRTATVQGAYKIYSVQFFSFEISFSITHVWVGSTPGRAEWDYNYLLHTLCSIDNIMYNVNTGGCTITQCHF